MFRPLRFAPHLLLVLLLAAGLAFGLATRFPEAEILARAENWPVLGPLAETFRDRYVQAPVPAPETPVAAGQDAAASPEIEIIQVIDPDMVGARPRIWARPGSAIYEERDFASREVGRVEHLFPLSLLGRDGDWYRVRYGSRLSGLSKGWVYLPGYTEPTEEELMAPAPVLPLPSVRITDQAAAAARRWMGEDAEAGRCGPYGLVTDVEATAVLAMCERVGSLVDGAHRRRYGLEPVGKPAETVLLFETESAFRSFRGEMEPDALGEAYASPADGYVAVPVGEEDLAAVSSTLIHELTHLLNRRALGPALPPWLNEGIARDLDTAGVENRPSELARLQGPGPVESLELLIDLDQAAFQNRSKEHYRAAGRWIGFLVDGGDPELARGTREFLRAVATGERISAALLLEHLGRDWPELEQEFRAWESPSG